MSQIASVNGISYSRLTIYDIKQVQDKLLASTLQTADALAKEQKLSKQELFNVLLQLKTNKPSISEVINYSQSSEGVVEVLKLSLQKGKVENIEEVISALPIPRAVELARDIVLDIVEEPMQENFPTPQSPSTGDSSVVSPQ